MWVLFRETHYAIDRRQNTYCLHNRVYIHIHLSASPHSTMRAHKYFHREFLSEKSVNEVTSGHVLCVPQSERNIVCSSRWSIEIVYNVVRCTIEYTDSAIISITLSFLRYSITLFRSVKKTVFMSTTLNRKRVNTMVSCNSYIHIVHCTEGLDYKRLTIIHEYL